MIIKLNPYSSVGIVRTSLSPEFGTVPACTNDGVGTNSKLEEPAMQKKSLTSTLKTAKKPNVAPAPAKKDGSVTKKIQINYKLT